MELLSTILGKINIIKRCAKCRMAFFFQKIGDGFCKKCGISVKLAGVKSELDFLKNRPHGGLNFDQAKRHFLHISKLESEIANLEGQLHILES